ncbi:MAG TPA: type II toxin-antitoxin system CcdA family antitoxin [Gammaproteobacteria bacterium]|nr:type II toxin-antitoxin system CcdA family antitoxin [Gammaproteobacteria bacterium]
MHLTTASGNRIEEAPSQGINPSQLLEEDLREVLGKRRRQAWHEDNREAIRQYNETVAERGSFGDRFRRF